MRPDLPDDTPPENPVVGEEVLWSQGAAKSRPEGEGALATGNRFVGIELEPESFETARQRIDVVSQTISESETTNA